MTAVNLRKYGVGSRKRVAQIRWKRHEIVHAAILLLLMVAFCVWVGIWVASHTFD